MPKNRQIETRKNHWLLFSGIALIAVIIFLITPIIKQKKIERFNQTSSSIKNSTADSTKKISAEKNIAPFFISAWLPYWEKTNGANLFQKNANLFQEINPFAFGVNPDGTIKDTLKIENAPWPELENKAKESQIKIIPTILWADAELMHKIFLNQKLEDRHIEAIVEMLKKNNFSGVDIDYEGKNISDKDLFTNFLKNLSAKLKIENKNLSCTIEARTQDNIPLGMSGTRAMSFANDFNALNTFCDTVHLMAYDEVFQIHRSNTFENATTTPSAPNADNQWVEAIIEYALKFISPEKIVLGVPTYGWKFQYKKSSNGYRYMRIKSVNYLEAIETAHEENTTPIRNSGGELSFTYANSGKNYIITFSDAGSVQEKIKLAKKFKLKGINLFKLDGLFDSQIFTVLQSTHILDKN
jgi:spore germination protein YaaH